MTSFNLYCCRNTLSLTLSLTPTLALYITVTISNNLLHVSTMYNIEWNAFHICLHTCQVLLIICMTGISWRDVNHTAQPPSEYRGIRKARNICSDSWVHPTSVVAGVMNKAYRINYVISSLLTQVSTIVALSSRSTSLVG